VHATVPPGGAARRISRRADRGAAAGTVTLVMSHHRLQTATCRSTSSRRSATLALAAAGPCSDQRHSRAKFICNRAPMLRQQPHRRSRNLPPPTTTAQTRR